MTDVSSLYEQDFVRWSDEQAAAIRAAAASGANLPLDWDHLAEEIEDLGRSVRAELSSRLATIVEHLFKLHVSPSVEPRRGWIETIRRERVDVERLLDENPSLRATLGQTIRSATRRARKLAEISLDRHDELSDKAVRTLAELAFSEEEVLGPWLPGGNPKVDDA